MAFVLIRAHTGALLKERTRSASQLSETIRQSTYHDMLENYAWAQYFLARSLIDLGLTHAGASYLARIARERTNPNVLPRALESIVGVQLRDCVTIGGTVAGRFPFSDPLTALGSHR